MEPLALGKSTWNVFNDSQVQVTFFSTLLKNKLDLQSIGSSPDLNCIDD